MVEPKIFRFKIIFEGKESKEYSVPFSSNIDAMKQNLKEKIRLNSDYITRFIYNNAANSDYGSFYWNQWDFLEALLDTLTIKIEINNYSHFIEILLNELTENKTFLEQKDKLIEQLQKQKEEEKDDFKTGNKSSIQLWESEGLSLQNPIKSLRMQTCKKVWNELDLRGLVLVKAPPFTGKSSLAYLLKYYIKERCKNVDPYLISIGIGESKIDNAFNKYTNFPTAKHFFEYVIKSSKTIVLIVDEAQLFYKECDDFITQIKEQLKDKIHLFKFICFAGYGINNPDHGLTTPLHFTLHINFHQIRFLKEEYKELIKNFNEFYLKEEISIKPTEEDYLFTYTQGHVGLIKFSLELISRKFKEVPTLDIQAFLVSIGYLNQISQTRALSDKLALLDDYGKQIVSEIEFKGRFVLADEKFKETATYLTKVGFLCTDDAHHYVVASELILKMYFQKYKRFNIPLMDKFKTLDFKNISCIEFPLLFLESMSGTNLKKAAEFKRKRNPKNPHLYERYWQIEVKEAISKTVSPDISINPEVPPFECEELSFAPKVDNSNNEMEIEQDEDLQGKLLEEDEKIELFENNLEDWKIKKGYLDFYINDRAKYGIEILREGYKTTIEEHLSRFEKPYGKYSKMIFNNYTVIDFRSKEPKKFYGDHYMAAVFDEEFTKLDIYHNEKRIASFLFLEK